MSKFQYKKFDGEDFILMYSTEKKADAILKAGILRAKHGRARVVVGRCRGCDYNTMIDCDECKYGVGSKNPEAKCNQDYR